MGPARARRTCALVEDGGVEHLGRHGSPCTRLRTSPVPVSDPTETRPVRPNGLEVRGRRHLRGWSPRDLIHAIGEAQRRATGLRETITPHLLRSVEEQNVVVPYATLCLIAAGLDCNPVDLETVPGSDGS